MKSMRLEIVIFAIVAILAGGIATQFDLVTDTAMLVVLAIGMIAMGIGVYQQRKAPPE